jgi:hypothetical protein
VVAVVAAVVVVLTDVVAVLVVVVVPAQPVEPLVHTSPTVLASPSSHGKPPQIAALRHDVAPGTPE